MDALARARAVSQVVLALDEGAEPLSESQLYERISDEIAMAHGAPPAEQYRVLAHLAATCICRMETLDIGGAL